MFICPPPKLLDEACGGLLVPGPGAQVVARGVGWDGWGLAQWDILGSFEVMGETRPF